MSIDTTKSVNEIVADILQKSLNAVQDGTVWLQGQLPDIIRQFILLHIAQDIFYICLGGLFVTLGWIGYFRFKKARGPVMERGRDTSGYTFGMGFSAFVGTLFGSMFILINLFDLLTLLIAPKIYLLEYVARLISTHR